MSTYLLAFIVSEFASIGNSVDDVQVPKLTTSCLVTQRRTVRVLGTGWGKVRSFSQNRLVERSRVKRLSQRNSC